MKTTIWGLGLRSRDMGVDLKVLWGNYVEILQVYEEKHRGICSLIVIWGIAF